MSEAPIVSKFDAHHGTWRPFRGDLPGQSRRLDLEGQFAFGAGFTRIDRSYQLQIRASSDQILYVVSGELAISPRAATADPPSLALTAHAGDAVQIRSGAQVSLGIVGHCHFFYALSPDIDWRTQLLSRA